MSRYILGDQLGSIKVLQYFPEESKIDVKRVYHQEVTPASSVERLAINSSSFNDQTTVCTNFLHYIWKLKLILKES